MARRARAGGRFSRHNRADDIGVNCYRSECPADPSRVAASHPCQEALSSSLNAVSTPSLIAMFIKKDLRKIPEIVRDSQTNESSALTELSLNKRKAEFHGTVKPLCEPAFAPSLSTVTSLSLYDCGIVDLTGLGDMFPSLKTLSCGQNPISEVPSDLCKLSNLERLFLEDCQLSDFPETVLELTLLTELRLSRNQIAQVPDKLAQSLPLLRTLCLDRNQLESLPALDKLPSLQTLQIRQNKLRLLPPLPPNLKLLCASSNLLDNIDVDDNPTFASCRELTHVYLNCNKLTTVPNFLMMLPNLKHANVAHNAITTLSADAVFTFGELDQRTGICSCSSGGCKLVVMGNPLQEEDTMDVDDQEGGSEREIIPQTVVAAN